MTRKTTKTRAEAKKLMWEYYSENKDWLPKWIREYRENILDRLIVGVGTTRAFQEFLEIVD